MPAPDARARAIVARLSEGNSSSDEVFEAFEELDHLPPEIVRGALETWTGPAPDPERLDDQVRRAHRLPLRTPRLALLETTRDADVLDLGDLAENQIRLAGKAWDGQDLEAFDRLDGERDDSWAGTLERRVFGEGGKPLYDVILFGDGAGVIFRGNTTNIIGLIADQRIETTDRPARAALEQVLRDRPAQVERVTREQLSLPIAIAAAEPKPKAKAVTPPPPPVVVVAEEADEEEAIETVPAPKKKKAAAAPKKKAAAEKAEPAPKKKKAAAAAAPKKAAAKTAAKAPAKKAAAAPKKKAAAAAPKKKKS